MHSLTLLDFAIIGDKDLVLAASGVYIALGALGLDIGKSKVPIVEEGDLLPIEELALDDPSRLAQA